jgi:Protein of unknown function (DUF3455)
MIGTRVAALAGLFAAGATMVAACGQGTAGASAPQGVPTSQATASAVADTDDKGEPASLNVPAGQKMVADMQVDKGSQVYTCTAGKWTLLEPAAVLRSGNSLVLHTRGPQWISPADGSAVTGTAVVTVPKAGAVPELLLKSSANRGTGLFGSVDYIQRLNTEGGVAPAGSCTDGAQQAVSYSAEYRFYVPSNK